MTDFYDDAILSFDLQVRRIFRELIRRELLDNTVVVICTDHGMNWSVNGRIPLLCVFPGGKHSGRIKVNVQNLDIAPTLLDYLGLEPPEWMSGVSLLSSEKNPSRIILTFDRKHGDVRVRTEGGWIQDESKVRPPFEKRYMNWSACPVRSFVCFVMLVFVYPLKPDDFPSGMCFP
jgi:arylsulfatase A-like enzyme